MVKKYLCAKILLHSQVVLANITAKIFQDPTPKFTIFQDFSQHILQKKKSKENPWWLGVFEKISKFRFELISLVKNFASFRNPSNFVMRSKPNRERLDSSVVTSMLYSRAALHTASYDRHINFRRSTMTQMSDDETISKYFKTKLFPFFRNKSFSNTSTNYLELENPRDPGINLEDW